jgi:1,2-diacylglycerol 3-beta-galactosyltransferase
MAKKVHILFLFSDTGGGHRSATEAIVEALHLEYGEQFSTEMVDIFKEYAPRPLNRMPDLYPKLMRLPRAWGLGYRLSNGNHRTRLVYDSLFWPYVRSSTRALIAQHPSDMIVCLHPLANAPILRALGNQRPPYITVVTDLVTTHAAWYHRRTDLCLVPTPEARERALHFGLRADQVQVVGLPVAERFCQPPGDRRALRAELGWPPDLPIAILVGGGEGMGPLEKNARAIAAAGIPLALVVICGRNQALKERLEVVKWPMPTYIYGFVHDMPDFMRAADILVTKAGPGTVSEAFNAGLPMILYSRLPGQEDGNVTYVVSEGAGLWAPRTEQVVGALRTWVDHPLLRSQAVEACHRLAHPQAARQIARILAQTLDVSEPLVK